MPHRIPSPSAAARGFVIVAASLAPLCVAPAAHAATFVAAVKDAAGDAPRGSTDLRRARVAYNRKSGAISVSVTMKDAIDAAGDDAIVTVLFSDLVDGRCRQPTLAAGVILSVPGVSAAFTMKGTRIGRDRIGTSSIEGDTVSFRIRHRSLSGKTPGCTHVGVFRSKDGERGDLLDESKGNDGFRTD